MFNPTVISNANSAINGTSQFISSSDDRFYASTTLVRGKQCEWVYVYERFADGSVKNRKSYCGKTAWERACRHAGMLNATK